MRTSILTGMVACSLMAAVVGDVRGQMFGARTLGQPLGRRPGAGALDTMQEEVGTLRGNERFLRANRRATDFVGPDIRDLERFVGMLQARARGSVSPTTEGLRRRVDRSESMNQPVPPPARRTLYYPRLEVSFDSVPADTTALGQRALETLARSPELSGPSRIAVYVEGRTAILLGEVPSARDRELAELLISFEPGISAIRNELQLNPNLQVTEGSLAALRQRQTPRQAWMVLPTVPVATEPMVPPPPLPESN